MNYRGVIFVALTALALGCGRSEDDWGPPGSDEVMLKVPGMV